MAQVAPLHSAASVESLLSCGQSTPSTVAHTCPATPADVDAVTGDISNMLVNGESNSSLSPDIF